MRGESSLFALSCLEILRLSNFALVLTPLSSLPFRLYASWNRHHASVRNCHKLCCARLRSVIEMVVGLSVLITLLPIVSCHCMAVAVSPPPVSPSPHTRSLPSRPTLPRSSSPLLRLLSLPLFPPCLSLSSNVLLREGERPGREK